MGRGFLAGPTEHANSCKEVPLPDGAIPIACIIAGVCGLTRQGNREMAKVLLIDDDVELVEMIREAQFDQPRVRAGMNGEAKGNSGTVETSNDT